MAPAQSREDALARLADASERMRQVRIGATLRRAPPAGGARRSVAGAAEEKEEYDVIIEESSMILDEDSSSSDSDPPSSTRSAEVANRAVAGTQAASGRPPIPDTSAGTRPQPTSGRTGDINVCANIGDRASYTALDSEDEVSARGPDPVWADSDDEYVPDPLDQYAYAGGDDPDAGVNEDDALWHAMPNKDEIEQWGTTGWDPAPVRDTREHEYAHLYDGLSDPAPEVAAIAENPLWLFFYFFPKKLFHVMAEESNRYALRRLGTKAAEIHRWQSQNAARDDVPSEFVETEQQILARLRVNFQRFKPEEYAKVFGLFIARVMYPHDSLARHWNPDSSGAIPAGTFHKVMPKSRFDDLIKNWHFADDNDPRARTDRVWKVRPLIEALQETFKRGHQASPFLSFGEGAVLSPPRSDWVRWRRRFEEPESDTKLFLTCCSTSAYCLRFEVYCGKKTYEDERVVDQTAGPIAVLRNIDLALPARRSQYHVVTMDRKFTSVPLVLELLARKVYAIGQVHQRRVGLPVQLMDDEDERRPRNVPPGPCAAARSRAESSLVACRWWDLRPLLLIGTGASLEVRSIERKSRITGETEQVPCPKIAVDYQTHNKGVETFNRMRHSDLSVQRMFRFKKLYKSIALALLDCALTNAYIAHKQTYVGRAKKYMKRSEFLMTLHTQLIQLQPSDLALPVEERQAPPSGPAQVPPARISFLRPPPRQVQQRVEPPTTTAPALERPVESVPREVVASTTASTPAPALVNRASHYPCETQDFLEATNGQGRKRMARGCKVCSYLAPRGTRGLNTKFYCPGCSVDHSVDVYLCIMARHVSGEARKTCFQIWHDDWQCGKQLPHGDKRLHFRPPTGKKRRRRSEQESGDDQQD